MDDKIKPNSSINIQTNSTGSKTANDNNIISSSSSSSSPSSSIRKPERSTFIRILGLALIFLTVISFLFVGLIINLLQLILLLSSKLSSKREWISFHKKLNGHLLYILFSPCIFLAYYWSNIKLNIQLDDLKLIEDSRKPIMGLMIPNHSYEIDYMVCFVLADQLGNLGSYKSISKYELKYLPVIGWAMWMGDIIFVNRNWKKDKPSLGMNLAELFNYEQFLLGLFAEGTRFTKEKHEISKEFALSRGLNPLKYHLQPRARGFNYTVKYYLKELYAKMDKDTSLFRIFNLQIIMPPNLKFSDFLQGNQLTANVYCEEVKISDNLRMEVIESCDVDNDDDCPMLTKLLEQIYERKDEIVDQFNANGNQFQLRDPKRGGEFPCVVKRKPALIWLAGFCMTYATFAYLALMIYAESLTFWTIVISFVTACGYMLKRIERESETKSLSICSRSIINNNNNNDINGNKQKQTVDVMEKDHHRRATEKVDDGDNLTTFVDNDKLTNNNNNLNSCKVSKLATGG